MTEAPENSHNKIETTSTSSWRHRFTRLSISDRALSMVAMSLATAALVIVLIQPDGRTSPSLRASIDVAAATSAVSATDPLARMLFITQYLESAAAQSAPYDAPLALALHLMRDYPSLTPLFTPLMARAETGVTDRARLISDMHSLLSLKERSDEGVSSLTVLLSGARTTVNKILGYDSVWSKAQTNKVHSAIIAELDDNNLEGALSLLAKMQPDERKDLSEWMKTAQARVELDNALAELRRAVIRKSLG